MLDVKGLDTLIKLRDKTASQLDYALAQHAKSNYKVRPTFVFHNLPSRLRTFCNFFDVLGNDKKTNPSYSPLRASSSQAAPDAAQTPLLSAVDATNNRLNVGVTPLTGANGALTSPPYGSEIDSIEYYQILLEQYNELVETKQQEFICWHAWHEQTTYKNFVDGEEAKRQSVVFDESQYDDESQYEEQPPDRLTLTPTSRSSLGTVSSRPPLDGRSKHSPSASTMSHTAAHHELANEVHSIYRSAKSLAGNSSNNNAHFNNRTSFHSSSKSLTTPVRNNRARSNVESPVSLPSRQPNLQKSSSTTNRTSSTASSHNSAHSTILNKSNFSQIGSSEFQVRRASAAVAPSVRSGANALPMPSSCLYSNTRFARTANLAGATSLHPRSRHLYGGHGGAALQQLSRR